MTTPQSPQTSTAVDAILDDFRANVVAWDANRGIKKAEAKAKINALIRDARLEEIEGFNTSRHYGKDYQDSMDALAEYKEGRIKQLTEEVTE